jgi:hypothetical protein
MDLVRLKYGGVTKQMKNIADYEKLKHFDREIKLDNAKEVIKFYTRHSFYH